MSDKKEQNQQRDYFSQYIMEQLKSHQVTVDEYCWDEIKLRLRTKRNRLLLRRSIYFAGVAVIALLLMVSFPVNEESIYDYPQINNEIIVSEVITKLPGDNQVINSIDIKPLNSFPVAYIEDEHYKEELKDFFSENKTETENKAEDKTEDEKEKTIVNEKKKHTELPVLPERNINLTHQATQTRNWQVSAGFITMGSNTRVSGQSPSYNNYNPGNFENGYVNNTNTLLRPDIFDDISYNLPLSFGLTVRKELVGNLSVETGLVYTYISTNFRKNSPNLLKGKLGLHYLGIPVNMIIGLWDNPNWEVYTSVGAMVEKGLASVYTQHTYHSNITEERTEKTSVPGVQWSLNWSLGISYRVHRNWSLYAEPKSSYFFDNNQPISMRTEKPLTIGFGLGVRFDF